MKVREPEDVDSGDALCEHIKDCLMGGDLAQMRSLLSGAPVELLTSERAALLAHVLIKDPVLKDRCRELAQWLADEAAEDASDVRGRLEVHSTLMMAMVDCRSRPASYLASWLLQGKPGLRAVQFAATFSQSREERTTAVECLVANLDWVSKSSGERTEDIRELMLSSDHERVGRAVVAARPRTEPGYMLQHEMFCWLFEAGQWRPEKDEAIEMFRATLAVSEGLEDYSTIPKELRRQAFLRGYARECVKHNRGRCAAFLSLLQILTDPDIEAIERGIFESARGADWELLKNILAVAHWPEHECDPDRIGLFHYSITPAVLRLASNSDKSLLTALLDLAANATSALNGAPDPRTVEFNARLHSGRLLDAQPGAAEAKSVQMLALAIFGADDPDALSTRIVDARVDKDSRGKFVWDAQSVLLYALSTGVERGRGPGPLLFLLDFALEAGDLIEARRLLQAATVLYPRHSRVADAGFKVALHIRNSRETRESQDRLALLIGSPDDEAAPSDQVELLESLCSGRDLRSVARGGARKALRDPRFAEYKDRLDRIARAS